MTADNVSTAALVTRRSHHLALDDPEEINAGTVAANSNVNSVFPARAYNSEVGLRRKPQLPVVGRCGLLVLLPCCGLESQSIGGWQADLAGRAVQRFSK